jgi:TldD protein
MLEEMLDLLRQVIDRAASMGVKFADIRIERVRYTRIEVREGVVNIVGGLDVGAAVRVLLGGSLGFAYTTDISREGLEGALQRARALAAASKGEITKFYELDPAEEFYRHPVKTSIEDVPIDVKVSDILELDKLLAKEALVKSRNVFYVERSEEKLYASTEGRILGEARELVSVASSIYGAEAGVRASVYESQGTIKGYYVWEKTSQNDLAEKLITKLKNQFNAVTPKAGIFPVVMGPKALGVFVHEAFGHLAEADLVAAGSALQGRRGEVVASELVTIVDDPEIDDGYGTIRYDDEGVRTSRATIVEKGVHKQVMNDRIHAALFNDEPTGNARAESFRYSPIVRMRNTVMLPGDHSVEEVFEGIDFGYYIVSTRGGQTNLDGSFQVGVEEAYEIVNGEIGKPVRNLGIAGNTLETLQNIDAVGKDFHIAYGRCGKGQLVYVSDGGPHVRVRKMTVGGRS